MKIYASAKAISIASFSFAVALSSCSLAQTAAPDGVIMVEAQTKPGTEWKNYPTRTLDNLPDYTPLSVPFATDIYGG